MNYKLWIRIALGYLAANCLQLGMWSLFFPKSFYDNFPGLGGSAWIAVDGPYNEHLIRDVGALNLALLVVLVSAAWTLSKPVIYTAAAATATWGIPHFFYHLFNREGLSSGDLLLSLGGLATFAGLPFVVAYIAKNKLEVSPLH